MDKNKKSAGSGDEGVPSSHSVTYECMNRDNSTESVGTEMSLPTNISYQLNRPIPLPPPPIETLHFDSRYIHSITSQTGLNPFPRTPFPSEGFQRSPAAPFGLANGVTGNDSSRSIAPVALPNGIIQLCLRNGIRVDMTLDKAVRVTNTLSDIVISLSSGGDSAAVNHPNGKVYQLGPFVEITAFDGKMNNNYVRYAKLWQEGITFTCTDCTHIFLVDLYGTRATSDTFTNMSHDFTLPVFLNSSKHGPIFANEARNVVQRSSHFHSNDGTDEYYINDFRISQKPDGLVKVTRSNNRCLIRTSPEHHSATLTTANIHCTASLSHTPHLFVRRQEQSMHFDGSSFVVRNNGHSAGFDENNYLRVY
ncbi:uncharacterized protein LOC119080632 isoform X1 [Bradysia coprophila]|uniref:uncharacterized protein LOC119080632 isoform X1 n=1 Tax=Bradysia coprophila TaxID=38358 RepID=UPI00187DD120|nr:uncharacterized protein LOC119080632 isoform X1 [Bradysia coprophila]